MALYKFICVVVTVAGLSPSQGKFHGLAKDWCNVTVCAGKENTHTFCLFPNAKERYLHPCNQSKLVTDDKTGMEFTDLYNDFRNKWAGQKWPGQKKYKFTMASNMRVLNFDYELHAIALRTTVNCFGWPLRINPAIICTKLDRFYHNLRIGQYEETTKPSLRTKVTKRKHLKLDEDYNLWSRNFNLTKPSTFKNYTNYDGGMYTYHITEMLTANMRSIALAENRYEYPRIRWKDLVRTVENTSGIYIVLAYGPRSLNLGENVYTEGFPGTNCPIGTVIFYDPRYPYLCGGELGYYLPGGMRIDNLPNRTGLDDVFGLQPNLVSNALLVVIAQTIVFFNGFSAS